MFKQSLTPLRLFIGLLAINTWFASASQALPSSSAKDHKIPTPSQSRLSIPPEQAEQRQWTDREEIAYADIDTDLNAPVRQTERDDLHQERAQPDSAYKNEMQIKGEHK